MSTVLRELEAGDDPQAWRRLGFTVDEEDSCRLGEVLVRLDGRGGGLRGWVLEGEGPAAVDGVVSRWVPPSAAASPAQEQLHPNGTRGLDHVVVLTDSRDRTVAALAAAGGNLRRRRDPPDVPVPMAFVRLGATIVEVAQGPGPGTRMWGLAVIVPDVDALAARYDAYLGKPRPAVQAGRRIVTARRGEGLGVALAFMTPRAAELA